MPLMQIAERRVGPVTILTLTGRLILDEGEALLRQRIDALVDDGRLDIVLNLHDVNYIDSCGVGAVVSKYVSVRRRGGELKVVCPSDRCRRVLCVSGLLKIFQPCESEEVAVRGLLARHELPV